MGVVEKEMKILITGSNGQLGQKLTLLCLEHRISFLATANSKNSFSFCPDENFRLLDVTKEEEVRSVVRQFKPTHIINTAAMTNVDACEVEVDKCYAINTKAVEYLLDASQEISAHLIQISTDFIFDGQKKLYSEESEARPLGEYGKSKWEAECILSNSNYLKITILRTSVLYGIGENLNKSNIFSWALTQLRKNETIRIVNDQFRTPTFVNDLATACFLVIKKEKTGVFNIAGGELASMYEWIVKVAQYLDKDTSLIQPVTTADLSQKAPRPQSSGLIIDKAKSQLNYEPTSFMESLKQIDLL